MFASQVRIYICGVQELLREALEEERARSENAIQQAVERAQEQVRTKMEDMAKV